MCFFFPLCDLFCDRIISTIIIVAVARRGGGNRELCIFWALGWIPFFFSFVLDEISSLFANGGWMESYDEMMGFSSHQKYDFNYFWRLALQKLTWEWMNKVQVLCSDGYEVLFLVYMKVALSCDQIPFIKFSTLVSMTVMKRKPFFSICFFF